MHSVDAGPAGKAAGPEAGQDARRRAEASARNRRRRNRSSLSHRFMLLQAGIFACLMGLMLYLAAAERRVALQAAEARVSALASLAAQHQNAILEQGRSVLAYLAEAPQIRSGGAACDAYLARFKSLYPWISSLRSSALRGELIQG